MAQTYTLYRELVCSCRFPIMLGMLGPYFWRIIDNDPFVGFHSGLVHSQ